MVVEGASSFGKLGSGRVSTSWYLDKIANKGSRRFPRSQEASNKVANEELSELPSSNSRLGSILETGAAKSMLLRSGEETSKD
jgi:hypothetical protein